MRGRRPEGKREHGGRRVRVVLAAGLALLAVGGCTELPYYAQAVGGHLAIMRARVPIETLLADPATDPVLRGRLARVQEARRFALSELGLPDNGSYRAYVALDREAVTWNVYATPEFSLEPRRWCFPAVGCVAYRGYFAESAARAYASELAAQGWDVYVAPASAYSSLGWFEDPVLSTMLQRGELSTVGVLFHELAHQRVYVKGDTAFNESFATAVQRAGVRRWLQARGEAKQLAAYARALERRAAFLALLRETRARLAAIYDRGGAPAQLRAQKRAVLEDLRERYRSLAGNWADHAGYDRWFQGPLNNARFVPVALYGDLVEDFLGLLERCGGDFRRFYAEVARIGRLPRAERPTALRRSACTAPTP